MLYSEKIAMHNAVLAEPVANAFLQAGDYMGLRTYLNEASNPSYIVWRTAVDPLEIMQNGLDWSCVDDLTVGKARIWEWLTKMPTFNPSKINVRAGIDAAWEGTSADLAVRTNVYSHCKRDTTNAERLTASGTGTSESPGSLTWEGEVGEWDACMLVLHEDGTPWNT